MQLGVSVERAPLLSFQCRQEVLLVDVVLEGVDEVEGAEDHCDADGEGRCFSLRL